MTESKYTQALIGLEAIASNIKDNEIALWPLLEGEDWSYITDEKAPSMVQNTKAIWVIEHFNEEKYSRLMDECKRLSIASPNEFIRKIKKSGEFYLKYPIFMSNENINSYIIDQLRTKYNLLPNDLTEDEWVQLYSTTSWETVERQVARKLLALAFYRKYILGKNHYNHSENVAIKKKGNKISSSRSKRLKSSINRKTKMYELNLKKFYNSPYYDELIRIISINHGWLSFQKATFEKRDDRDSGRYQLELENILDNDMSFLTGTDFWVNDIYKKLKESFPKLKLSKYKRKLLKEVILEILDYSSGGKRQIIDFEKEKWQINDELIKVLNKIDKIFDEE